MGLLNSLIAQAKNPKGFVGKTMLKIMNSAHSQMMTWGLSKIDIGDKSVILDVGCGGGKTIKILSSIIKQGRIYGIDYSEDAVLASLKENQEDVNKGKVIIEQSSVSSMPFLDDLFDLVTAFQTHYFWPDLKNDVKEVNRILKPKGHFLLVAEIYKINYHMTAYKTVEALKELFMNSGFSNINVFETDKNVCFVGTK